MEDRVTPDASCHDDRQRTVSVILTVRNDAPGLSVTLESLRNQSRKPDEIIVVDGGSIDDTRWVVKAFRRLEPAFRYIEAVGSNIAEGRNIATRAALGEIIASIDAGCRAEPQWLQRLVEPFEATSPPEFVAGAYRIEPHSLLEHVIGLATMRGQLAPIDPETYNASGRSMAYTKALWSRAAGWPSWLRYSEDTVFNHKIRNVTAERHVAEDAVVHWRPRSSFRALARQFYFYGTGRGHTQIDAASFHYNLRNLLIVAITGAACIKNTWMLLLTAALIFYFYVWTFHHKARQIEKATRSRSAYLLTFPVMWTVLGSNLVGYCVGTLQRIASPHRYADRLSEYLSTGSISGTQ